MLGIAAVAGFLGDQFYFWLGRRHGPAVLARWPSLTRQTDRVHRWLTKSGVALIIGVRFAYGLRAAGAGADRHDAPARPALCRLQCPGRRAMTKVTFFARSAGRRITIPANLPLHCGDLP